MNVLHVIRYCAEECDRQRSGELSVANMFDAWRYADWVALDTITEHHILELGRRVEPRINADGYRKSAVVFQNGNQGIPWDQIPRAMNNLLQAQSELTPVEFYKEYQLVHCFEDGNGRVGSLLYNIVNGSIEEPIAPPNIFALQP